MVEIQARLDELSSLGLRRGMRLVSGPQGAHVLLDGRPVLLLCFDNYRGLADHPRIRKAPATPIVSSVIGDAARTVAVGEAALERGVFTQAIRPPTVPEPASRLRLT